MMERGAGGVQIGAGRPGMGSKCMTSSGGKNPYKSMCMTSIFYLQ
jgi:hypothetical protein